MPILDSEEKTVLKLFHQNWEYRSKIVLYGIGRHTKNIISYFPSADIIGIMSADQNSGSKWGKPFLSISDVISLCPNIIIVAREAVIPVIVRRLTFLFDYGISLYSLSGNTLNSNSIRYNNEKYYKINKNIIYNEVERYTYISFDLFDTLIMRKVLKAQQNFICLSSILKERKWSGNDEYFVDNFYNCRMKFFNTSYLIYTLYELYKIIQDTFQLSDSCMNYCYNTEINLDHKLIIPRYDMLDLLKDIKKYKKCYIISDSNYSSLTIHNILSKLGFNFDIKKIIVSCEAKCSKEDGGELFTYYLNKIHAIPDQCLHIGDNRIADITNAKINNISTLQVLSAEEMILHSSFQPLLDNEINSEKNRVTGFFAANYFNSPFSLYNSSGLINISSLYEIGKYFIAPLCLHYFLWLEKIITQRKISHIFYSSRDGFLFNIIHRILKKRGLCLPSSSYILTSRRLCLMSYLQNVQDILESTPHFFSGTIKDFFYCRFGIIVDDYTPFSYDYFISILNVYKKTILNKSKMVRSEYIKYINKFLKKHNYVNIGFFDFAASGSVQLYLEKLLHRNFIGCYFAKGCKCLPIDIEAPMKIVNYGDDYFSQFYLQLECIFTAPHTSVATFSEGKPVFEGSIYNKNFKYMKQIHKGIIDAITDYDFKIFGSESDLNQAIKLCWLLFSDKAIVPDAIKKTFVADDLFMNRDDFFCWT